MVLSPHTDDGELGAGGTISQYVIEGYCTYYIAFSICEKSIPENFPSDILKNECLMATHELGIPGDNVIFYDYDVREFPSVRQEILDCMIDLRNRIEPDIVICPSAYDIHQDHQVIYEECVRAFKKSSSIWGMEHPWNNLSFRTDIYVELNESHIQKKACALKQYESQSFRDYFKKYYITAWAQTRGMQIGKEYAEVFECIRMLV